MALSTRKYISPAQPARLLAAKPGKSGFIKENIKKN